MTSRFETDCTCPPENSEIVLNTWPINRVALTMLTEAGETPDPGCLYILQLVLWALRTGKAEAEPDVYETVNAMTTWRPERLMNFLLLREDGVYEPPAWREAEDASCLALLLLEDLERKMVIHFPWYRSLEQ